MEEFKKLGLSDNAINVLKKKKYVTPTEIQSRAIPLLLAGKLDIIAQSQTGTGKTAAFALPIIEKVKEHSKHVQAIILTPTRELAIQVAKEIESLLGRKRLRVLAVYGGTSVSDQRIKLRRGIDVVVGTPGRVIDQIKRRSLDISRVDFAVLDEADEMLNMGFLDDIENILGKTSPHKKMLLFSATIPREIHRIAKRFMKQHVVLEVENRQLTIESTKQIFYEVMPKDRFEALRRIIDVSEDFYGIIFCKTRIDVDHLARKLIDSNYSAAAIHGDITQAQREKILNTFRDHKINILVATDVAARGIDVNDLTHVVNYSLPQSPESYVHRIGRTGRAGKKGIAVTFIIPSEKNKLRFIERIVNNKLEQRNLPSIDEVIAFRKKHIRQIVEQASKTGNSKSYENIAKEILISNTPVAALSSLLEYTFKSVLNPNNYKFIQDVKLAHRTSKKEKKNSIGRNYRKKRHDAHGDKPNFKKRRFFKK
ncbi:MAG: DEAD/DEAH box helicase [Nanoarchaeota archaeon]|nr:DEAD/DEAH box helicase [Nanoarchaeota archaeon]